MAKAKIETTEETTTETTVEIVPEDTTQRDMLGAVSTIASIAQKLQLIVQSTTDGDSLKRLIGDQIDLLQAAIDSFEKAGETPPEATTIPATEPEPEPTPV